MTSVSDALASPTAMFTLLRSWCQTGVIRQLDLAFARVLYQVSPDETESLQVLGAVMVSSQAGRGHLLLDLTSDKTKRDWPSDSSSDERVTIHDLMKHISLEQWQKALSRWDRVSDGRLPTPLVLDDGYLYLRRFWQLERQITASVHERLGFNPVDNGLLRVLLDAFFPPVPGLATEEVNWQKVACALTVRGRFSVVTGGPGTGKTSTVIKVLALLQLLQLRSGEPSLRIKLAAPTGKAAARLRQSIDDQVEQLAIPVDEIEEEIRASIPREVSTLHKLLGAYGSGGEYHFNALHPLHVDVVVIDEASMIDIQLMSALLAAIPENARLVLLGDKDQLASVEAGAVLGKLCAFSERISYDQDTRHWLESVVGSQLPAPEIAPSPLSQNIVMLRRSYRFDSASGIAALAQKVKSEDTGGGILELFDGNHHDDLSLLALQDEYDNALPETVLSKTQSSHFQWFHGISENRPAPQSSMVEYDLWAEQLFSIKSRFQLLVPLQAGPWGVSALNRLVEEQLANERLINREGTAVQQWYEGRPVLITRNNYQLGLMNGDIGITLQVPVQPGSEEMTLRVAFPSEESAAAIRWILPSRIAHCQTVFAMTVHKSQGSEFDEVMLILPDVWNPLLTKELIYTAVTRARYRFTLACSRPEVFQQAAGVRTDRASRLFGDQNEGFVG